MSLSGKPKGSGPRRLAVAGAFFQFVKKTIP